MMGELAAGYPSAQFSAMTVRAYWKKLQRFPMDVIERAIEEAERDSQAFFPPRPLVLAKAEAIQRRKLQEGAHRLLAGPEEASEDVLKMIRDIAESLEVK